MTSVYRRLKAALPVLVLVAVFGAGIASRTSIESWWTGITTPATARASPAAAPALAPEKDALTVPADVAKRLKVRTEPARPSTVPSTLQLSGSLILDADRLAHVHARFPGEVVELGKADNGSRPVAFGQHVRKGQLLAVIWSHDLGEKKSDLIDALSQLRVDEDSLARISKAAAEGSVPDRVLQDTRRKVEADRIAESRAVRTLQSWRISKEEIDHVRAEADRLSRDKTANREEMVAQWAKLEVLSPLDGTVIERNVVLGELVDTTTDLFKVADLSRLGVLAYAYEEDLPTLDCLPASQRVWSVTVGSGGDAATRIGRFDQVGCIIDPNQHTALVMGWVDNPDGKLRVGQFVTTRLDMPLPPGEVVVPASALCEESDRTSIFVQSDSKPTYVRRTVAVTGRRGDKVCIRSRPTREETRRGLEPLAAGEQVVVSRVVELSASLDTLQQNAGAPLEGPGYR
jgi:cobalt-zinc-cadmium efflux system membrane fusion protein